MDKFSAVISAIFLTAGAAQACEALGFDYSSFSRPPQKLDLKRYVAGREDVNYLSLGLNGITFQISPANYAVDTRMAEIWENWAVRGQPHPDFANFHEYFTPPERIRTPFIEGLVGYRSEILPEHRPADRPDMTLEAVFVFVETKGKGVASFYLNDSADRGGMEAAMAELAPLLTYDPACVSASGAYEGRYMPEEARFVVFPVEGFRDPL